MLLAGNGRRPEKMQQPAPTYAFVSSDTDDASKAAARLTAIYGQHSVADADVVVALGGDGFLLQTLRETMGTGKRVYGMNRGTVGFLMNEYRLDGLEERIPAPPGRTLPAPEVETGARDRQPRPALALQTGAAWPQTHPT